MFGMQPFASNEPLEETQVENEQAEPTEDPEAEVSTAKKPSASVAPFVAKLTKKISTALADKGALNSLGMVNSVVGIEPYGLALQYLIDLNVLPMQSVITVAGEPKSYKTSTLQEFGRMFLMHPVRPGIHHISETEGKWSPSRTMAMHPEFESMDELEQRLLLQKCDSIQAWQVAAGQVIKEAILDVRRVQAAIKAGKGSKDGDEALALFPIAISVDSVTGSQTEEIKEKVTDDGHGSKTFQNRAMLIWQWLDTWCAELNQTPITVILSQHLKDKIDASPMKGRGPSKITPGGSAIGYHTALEIRASLVGKKELTNETVVSLQWRCHHNTFGVNKRKLDLVFREVYVEDGKRHDYFDWDTTLTRLLMTIWEEGGAGKNRLQEVLGSFAELPRKGKVYTCERLGVDKERAEEEKIDAEAMGKLLQDPANGLRDELRKALRIQNHGVIWTPSTFL
jgi:hypothetical protein